MHYPPFNQPAQWLADLTDLTDFEFEHDEDTTPCSLRDSIKLIHKSRQQPSTIFVETMAERIMQDSTTIELFAAMWIDCEWELTPEVIFIIQQSYSGWKILRRANASTSRELISTLRALPNNEWLIYNALIGTNGSALEYLIHIDDDLALTIDTLNRYELWKFVLRNPAAEPIIDYALTHFQDVQANKFISRSDLKKWMFPLIGAHPSIAKYVDVCDIDVYQFSRAFFSNPAAIDLIMEWLYEGGTITSAVLDGLIVIATSEIEDAAWKAIYVIDNACGGGDIPIVQLLHDLQWVDLAQSTFGREFVIEQMETDMIIRLETILEECKIIPRWTYDSDNEQWMAINLNAKTVSNLDLGFSFVSQSRMFANDFIYDNWSVLIQTETGVDIALENVAALIDAGCLWMLLKSKFIEPEDIVKICNEFSEELSDADLVAIAQRNDAVAIDKKLAFEMRFDLNQEFMRVWYKPERLIAVAKRNGMDPRVYIEMFA